MDPFRKLQSGDRIEGFPRDLYNGLIDLLRGHKSARGGPAALAAPPNSGIIDVLNDTGEDQDQFAVLGLGEPIISVDDNETEFLDAVAFRGGMPTEGEPFVVCVEPIAAGVIGKAVISGVVQVKVTGTLADNAEAVTDTTAALECSGTGSAQILWAEAGSGERWAVVRIGGGGGSGGGRALHFTLPSALTNAQASKASCTVNRYWGGADPGGTVTVWNPESGIGGTYMFAEASGAKGTALYDNVLDRWWIVFLESRSKIKGALDGTLSYNGSATMSVWEWNGSSEADSGENVTVYDWLLSSGQTVGSGVRVTAYYDVASGRWYLDGAQCIS